jgi:transcriptional regulator with XRE-family HTH domain
MDDALHKQKVGERLRIAREALGLEQTEMAELYGLDKTKLSHWERGKHYPAPAFIARLWERHRIPADWIYLGEVSGVPHRLAENLLAGAAASAERPKAPRRQARGKAGTS